MGISSLPESSTCVLSSPHILDPSRHTVGSEPMDSMEWQEQDTKQDIDSLTQDCGPTQLPMSISRQTRSSTHFNQTAKMLLQLREDQQVSQVAISKIVSSCRLLCNQAVNALKGDVITSLNQSGEMCEDLGLVLNKDNDPFTNFDTNYLFKKFCVDHLDCLVSFWHKVHNCNVHV